MFVLPPLTVVLVVGIAQALSEGLQRIQPVKACFNVAQWMARPPPAASCSHLLRRRRHHADRPRPARAGRRHGRHHRGQRRRLRRGAAGWPAASRSGASWPSCAADGRPGLAHRSGGINLAFGILFVGRLRLVALDGGLLFLVPLGVLHWTGRAFASVRADRARLAGMQRATHALAVPMNPRDAVPEFLAEVRRCFESEVAELVILLEGSRVVHRSRDDDPATSSGSRRPAGRPWPRP